MTSPSRTGAGFLGAHRERLSSLGDGDFASAYERFLHALASADSPLPEAVDDSEQAGLKAFFTACQRRYLAIRERAANASLAKLLATGGTSDPSLLMDGFGRASYDRVSDLKRLVDFSACRSVVMVGCGAFPATLFWLHHNFPALRYVGLDIDPAAVGLAAGLAAAAGMGNISVRVADGHDYDFGGADLVYVANQVTPKKTVVARIATFPSVGRIVVREPTARGTLLAETVRADLPAAFEVENAGSESGAFLSYDLCLRRVGA